MYGDKPVPQSLHASYLTEHGHARFLTFYEMFHTHQINGNVSNDKYDIHVPYSDTKWVLPP